MAENKNVRYCVSCGKCLSKLSKKDKCTGCIDIDKRNNRIEKERVRYAKAAAKELKSHTENLIRQRQREDTRYINAKKFMLSLMGEIFISSMSDDYIDKECVRGPMNKLMYDCASAIYNITDKSEAINKLYNIIKVNKRSVTKEHINGRQTVSIDILNMLKSKEAELEILYTNNLYIYNMSLKKNAKLVTSEVKDVLKMYKRENNKILLELIELVIAKLAQFANFIYLPTSFNQKIKKCQNSDTFVTADIYFAVLKEYFYKYGIKYTEEDIIKLRPYFMGDNLNNVEPATIEYKIKSKKVNQ